MKTSPIAYPSENSSDDLSLHSGLMPRYQALRMLGSGGMGNVYLAKDTELSRLVAIKTIRPDLIHDKNIRKRIDMECRMHAAIGIHPNIVALYDRVEFETSVYLILEYVEGVLLADLLRSDHGNMASSLSFREKIAVIIQILEGLKSIHAKNIVHRDITPSNVIVSTPLSGQLSVKLMDFGIARIDAEDAALTHLTAVDVNGPGTPIYMAPERIDPQTFGPVSSATDLYSVGVILFQMFNDGPPFRGTVTEILMGHLTKEIDFTLTGKGFSHELQAILTRALAKKQKDRFPDAVTFINSLHNELPTNTSFTADECQTEHCCIAICPDLLRGKNGGTLVDTRSHLTLPHRENRSNRWLIMGSVVTILLLSSLFLWKILYVPGEKEPDKGGQNKQSMATSQEKAAPSKAEQNVSHSSGDSATNGSQKELPINEPIANQGLPAQKQDFQNKQAVNQSSEKKDSATAAFESARGTPPPSLESSAPERLKKELKIGNVNQSRLFQEKPGSSATEKNCRTLMRNWQLGDSSSMQQYRKECTQ